MFKTSAVVSTVYRASKMAQSTPRFQFVSFFGDRSATGVAAGGPRNTRFVHEPQPPLSFHGDGYCTPHLLRSLCLECWNRIAIAQSLLQTIAFDRFITSCLEMILSLNITNAIRIFYGSLLSLISISLGTGHRVTVSRFDDDIVEVHKAQ